MAILSWYLVILVIGLSFFPLSSYLFSRFRDRGWLMSKFLGLFLAGWFFWVLNCGRLFAFRQRNIWLIVILLAAVNYGLYCLFTRKGSPMSSDRTSGRQMDYSLLSALKESPSLIITEECLFLGFYLLAIYIIGFRPEAYGTEKFMDYGFLTSMARSLYMPFEDLWYAGKSINYYYGGQFYAAFLMKMSGVTAGQAYNLMRALITSGSFCLPFVIVYQLISDRLGLSSISSKSGMASDVCAISAMDKKTSHKNHRGSLRLVPTLAGLLGGTAVAFCGNGHYIIHGILYPLIKGRKYRYWFPDSTRYIGYDPDMPDKTIHEFPAYSTVLGDLHAHYINLIFVLVVVALVYAWAQRQYAHFSITSLASASKSDTSHSPSAPASGLPKGASGSTVPNAKSSGFGHALTVFFDRFPMFAPEILLTGLMTGVFRWTNFWDFPIYYVVAGSIIFFVNIRVYWGKLNKWLVAMIGEAAVMLGVGYLAALPFTLTFDQISSKILPTHSHTLFYQLLILWGLPAFIYVFFVVQLILEWRKSKTDKIKWHMPLPDLTVVMLGLDALGLVFLPEVIYVKDIYGGEHYRANTMFKLTYQAFILLGICMAYILIRTLVLKKKAVIRGIAIAALVFLLLTAGYIGKSVSSWFGNIFKPSKRINTDASVFVSESFSSDFDAVNYLNANVGGTPTILEAPGDSYSDYERISVATGLPTVAGWYVHEWLWRGGHTGLDRRIADIQTIYTSTDEGTVKALIKKYNITYIYIGTLEHKKYTNLNDALLQKIGKVVYSNGTDTYIMKVQ